MTLTTYLRVIRELESRYGHLWMIVGCMEGDLPNE